MVEVLVDTSVWINFFRGNETKASIYLKNNLASVILATCPIIVQEVLQGISDDKVFHQIQEHFNQFIHLPCSNEYELAVQATNLYRDLRKKGITIRKTNDCTIACYALNNNIPILHDDKDFQSIIENTLLKTVAI